MNACLLALDTSTDQLAAALQTGAGRRAVNEAGGARASTRLVPLLMQLLADAGIALPQVDAIAFGSGPGAFTGLRTTCAVAQGLAMAHQTPVLAIDSLLIVAEDARAQCSAAGQDDSGLWWVAMDARMDEAYAGAYQHGATGWQVHTPPRLWTLAALAETWAAAPPGRVAGNAAAAFGPRLPTAAAATWPVCADRAAALLRLADAAWRRGEGLPAEQALPVYLRDQVAQTTAERLARRLAAETAAAAEVAAP